LESDDIEEVIAAHEKYLNVICKRSFLMGNRLILSQLRTILRQIHDFCGQVELIFNSDTTYNKCLKIKEDFDGTCRSLLSRLQVLVAQEPHLSQLILRLDFNRFFSNNAIMHSISRISTLPDTVKIYGASANV